MRKNPFYKLDIDWHWKTIAENYAYAILLGMLLHAGLAGFQSPVWQGGLLAAVFLTIELVTIKHYQVLTEEVHRPPQLYRIETGEYKVLFRSPKSPPNFWTISHWDGPWMVLKNYYWEQTTCAILPKHVQKI